MRKITTKPTRPASSGDPESSKDGKGGWFKREWRLISLLAIIIVALVIRFVFAYGISAGSDYALSGGSGSSSHLHIIESILSGSYSITDSALNYPYGSTNAYPPLLDYLLAGIASIAKIFGVSTTTAAAGSLAFSAPIFAALTCIPIYSVGKKLFKDANVGLLAALFYAFFALIVMTTVFSNGTEYAFVGLLFAILVYFLITALERADDIQPKGLGSAFKNRSILVPTVIAGVLFAAIALSWGQFRIILLVLIFLLFAQAVIDRFRAKEVAATVGIYGGIIAIGILIPALYYVPAGLWDQVFSGPFVLGILALVIALVFAKTVKVSWVIIIPALIIVTVAIFTVLSFVAGDLFSAIVHGNSVIDNPLVNDLASSSRHTTVSSMASYYGWLTLWLPVIGFLYLITKYRKNADSRKFTFAMWWLLLMFVIGWYSSSYAVIAGAGFAVGSAYVLLLALRAVKINDYISDMRGNGVKHAFRKMLKPIPFVAVIALAVLIIAPNFVYAIDAATPTNSEDSDSYFGGPGYTIMTDDVNVTNRIWNEYQDKTKSGALVSWFGYSNSAVSPGGFSTATDESGGGASFASNVLLANSDSVASAVLALRLILAGGVENYSSVISAAGLNYNQIAGYINNPATAVQEVIDNPEKFPGISPELTEENAIYLATAALIASVLSSPDVNKFYDSVCYQSGKAITYVVVDRSMIPLYYGDSSLFPTIGYLGSYQSDQYASPTNFFSYNTQSGAAVYTDAMYNTFIWKAFIGQSPAAAGYSTSTELLNALALSDGKVKAQPGYGLNGYRIAYWHVMYNPDDSATVSSPGWEDKDAYEAIALQKEKGGLINYVSGAVMLEYNPGNHISYSGQVNYQSETGLTGAEGIQVAVFEKPSYGTGASSYVQKSTSYTKANGAYTISVPNDGSDYYVVFSSGTKALAGGQTIATYHNTSSIPAIINIPATGLKGTIVVGESAYTDATYIVAKGVASGNTVQADAVDGKFVFSNLLPDLYELTVYLPNGTPINAIQVPVIAGSNDDARIAANSGTITVTATDDHGAKLTSGTAVAIDTTTGAKFNAPIADGTAKLLVVPGTYNISVTGGKIPVSSTVVTVESKGTKTAAISAYDAKNVTATGAPAGSLVTLMSFGYFASSTVTTFQVPVSGGINTGSYTAYAVSGGQVYYGTSAGNNITLTGHAGYTITGTLKDVDDKAVTGTVAFLTSDGAVLIFTADEDGKFSAFVPAGSLVLYAYNSTNAILKTISVSGNADLGDVTMEKSRNVTLTLSYSTNMSTGSTKGLAFVDIKLKVTVDGTDYNLVVKTDTTGKAVFTIPVDNAAELTADAFDTAQFHMDAQTAAIATGSSNSTMSWNLDADPASTSGRYVKAVTVSSTVPVEITLYNSSSTKYTVSGATVVKPGQYSAKVSGSAGQYFDGTIYIYPGQTGNLNIDTIPVATATLTAAATDEITVTPIDEEAGKYYQDADNKLVYYLEKNKSFFFKAVSGSEGSTQTAYASASNVNANVTLNLSNKADTATVKGYVGAVADGKLKVSYGSVNLEFEINGGAFEFDIPTGTALNLTAEVSKEINGITYKYSGTTTVAAGDVKKETKVHFPVLTASSASAVGLTGSAFTFAGGQGTFTLSIKNDGDYRNTYIVTSGPGYILDKTYTIVIEAGATGNVNVSGRYDPAITGAGSSDLAVHVRVLTGETVGTYVIDGSAITPAGTTDTYVNVAGADDAGNDAVTGYEYLYAVTVKNNDNYQKTVTVNASLVGASGDWTLVISDKDGGNIQSNGTTFKVAGYSSTVIYVKIMSKNGASTDVPSLNVTVTAPNTVKTDSSSVSVSGNVATATLSTKIAEIESSDSSAVGDNIYNEQSSVPVSLWILLAAAVLILLFTIWTGMKRGVFVRRK